MIDATIKQRLKRLFAVAENDASCDNEIEQAMRYAKALMNQHQVTRDDVFEDEDTGEVDISRVEFTRRHRYSAYSSICAWESLLCKFITEFVPGTGYYINRGEIRRNNAGMVVAAGRQKCTQITFYGPVEDINFCLELWDEVVLVIETAATLRFGQALARGSAASYAEGFAMSLYLANKKQDEEAQETAKSDSKALIVVNRGLALVDGGKNWLKEKHGVKLCKGTKATSMAVKDIGAFKQGQADGSNYKPASQKRAGYIA